MSLSTKKIDSLKKDAKQASEKYENAAGEAITNAAKSILKRMSDNEKEHVKMLDVVEEHENKKEKKSFFSRFSRKEPYKEKVKEYFEDEGVYQEQGAEDEVPADRPELPEKNEWNEEYEE